MDSGYTFIWPTGQDPFFIRPDGMLVHLTVENYIPYLAPKSSHCKHCKATGSMSFKCATPVVFRDESESGEPGVAAHAHRPKAKTHTKKCCVEQFAVPSDTESDIDVPELVGSYEDESGQSSLGDSRKTCSMVPGQLLFVLASPRASGDLRAGIIVWRKCSCLKDSRRKLTGLGSVPGRKLMARFPWTANPDWSQSHFQTCGNQTGWYVEDGTHFSDWYICWVWYGSRMQMEWYLYGLDVGRVC